MRAMPSAFLMPDACRWRTLACTEPLVVLVALGRLGKLAG